MQVHNLSRADTWPGLGITAILLNIGGCQYYGPFLGTLNIRGRIIIGTQKDHNFDNHPYSILVLNKGSIVF